MENPCPIILRPLNSWLIPQTALELNGVLNSSKKQALFHHHFRVLARVPGLVSLVFWHPVPSSFPGSGRSGACLPTLLASCSIILFWFRPFRGLSPYSFGILFHHHFLVPAVPGLVSLLFWHPVPSSFPGSGRSGACLPTLLASCSIIISWFRPFRGLSPYSFGILFHHDFLVPARVPRLVSLPCSIIMSWCRLGFRACPPTLFHHHVLVPARVSGLVSLLFWHPVPSSFPGSG